MRRGSSLLRITHWVFASLPRGLRETYGVAKELPLVSAVVKAGAVLGGWLPMPS